VSNSLWSRKKLPQQKGGTLIISLILLLVMALLGVGSMDVSILALKLSSNYQASITNFSVMERDLLLAETAVDSRVASDSPINFDLINDGYYDSRGVIEIVDSRYQLENAKSVERQGADSEYLVEYIGRQQRAGSSLKIDHSGGELQPSEIHNFVITIRTQTEGGPAFVARSLYTTKEAP